MAEIIKVDKTPLKLILEQATGMILSGRVVALPTDTFYGLAADPLNLSAVNEIFRTKRRSADRPLPLLVDSLEMAADLAHKPPALFYKLADRFWPGALTIVVSAASKIPLKVTANTGKVGLRWPKAPLAVGLIVAVGGPVTGTSANLHDYPPCVTAEEVDQQIGESVPLIIDGGKTAGKNASTVVEVEESSGMRILRPGAISAEELKEFLA
jgi:tRNA threonylcarbamoyl adenosine modification protein (Sua5/YciO/YrdC/YwlC family)